MAADIIPAARALLLTTQGIAGAGTELPDDETRRPYLRIRRSGGVREATDNRVKRARVVVESWGRPGARGEAEASTAMLAAEDVLLPPSRVVHGYRGVQAGVYISNVVLESSWTWEPDPDTEEARYVATFLFDYYAV